MSDELVTREDVGDEAAGIFERIMNGVASDFDVWRNHAFQAVVVQFGKEKAEQALTWWNQGGPIRGSRRVQAKMGPLCSVMVDVGAAKDADKAAWMVSCGGVKLNGVRVYEPSRLVPAGYHLLEVGSIQRYMLEVTGSLGDGCGS